MISKQFVKSSLIYSIGNAMPMATAFILLPFYTNRLDLDDYGIFALYLGFSLFVQILANFSFDSYIGIHYFDYRDHPERLREFIGTIMVGLLVIGAGITLIFCLVGDLVFSSMFENLPFYPFGVLLVLSAVFNSFFKTYSNFLIYQQKPERFFIINFLNFVIIIALTIIGLHLYPYTLIGPIWARFIASTAVFIVAFIFMFGEFGLSYKKELVSGMLRFCFPFLVYLLLNWVLNNIDRFMINKYLTTEDVAIFDFAVKCIVVIDFFQNGLMAAINPKIFNLWKSSGGNESSSEVNRYFNGFTLINIVLLPIYLLLLPLVIPVFVKKVEYYEAFIYFPVLIAGFATRGAYYLYLSPVLYKKQAKLLPVVFFFSAIIQLIVMFAGLQLWGLWGAVLANFITKCIQVIFIYLGAKRIFRFSINVKKIIYFPLFYIGLTMSLYAMPQWEKNMFWYEMISMVFTWLVALFVFRNEIKLLPQFRKKT